MKLGILGASGAVGQEMIKVLEERDIKLEEIRFFGFSSIGQSITFNNVKYTITKPDFRGLDVVLGATDKDVAKEYKEDILNSGAIFIDNSNAFRLEDDVPLVVPQINGEDIFKHKGIIANPNCCTIIALMAAKPIQDLSNIKAIIASTYQAVSGAGVKGLRQLEDELGVYPNSPSDYPAFKMPILNNALAQIGSLEDEDYTSEELKMENEGRKIMHLDNLKVTCTCVRVPIKRVHSISMTIITQDKLDIAKVKERINNTKGLILDDLATPLKAMNKDEVYVSRIRQDRVFENGITLWVAGDQIRKGAATNAIEIMERLYG